MNIKTFHHKIALAVLFFVVTAIGSIALPQPASALTAKEACANKINEDCESKIRTTCEGKTGDEREECIKKRAGDFKDKEPILFNPPGETQAQRDRQPKCGNKESGTQVTTRIDFGCLGDRGPENMGPIEDLAYALVRFLSAGVGIVVVFFIILAGIQYSTSEGNPEQTQQAKNKIRDAIIALIIYIFAFAIVQYLVPGGVFATVVPVPDATIIRGIYE